MEDSLLQAKDRLVVAADFKLAEDGLEGVRKKGTNVDLTIPIEE